MFNVQPISDAKGVMVHESDEKRQVEITILQGILDTIKDRFVWHVDHQYSYTHWNRSFGETFKKFFNQELRKGESAILRIPHQWGSQLNFKEFYGAGLQGKNQTVRLEYGPSEFKRTMNLDFFPSEENGLITGVVVWAQDLTRQKGIEQKNRNNDASMRAVLNAMESIIALVDEDFSLLYFNRNYEYFFEKLNHKKPLLFKSVIDQFVESKFITELKSRFIDVCENKPVQFIYEHETESSIIISYKIEIVRNHGQVIGYALLGNDCTDLVKQERTLKQQYDELKILNSELDEFVYSASHDLRAPLMSIRGVVNLMRKESNLQSIQLYLEHIDKSVLRLDKFIHETINYSRNERTYLEPKEIDFPQLIEESIDSLKYMEDAHEVECIRIVEARHSFFSDQSRMLTIFSNIISNAFQYRDKNKRSFLKITVVSSPSHSILTFEDNGIGIDIAHLDKIFNMFYRAHEVSKGSGLGLYNVKNSVDRLDGIIEVKSQVGVGTLFRIMIPSM